MTRNVSFTSCRSDLLGRVTTTGVVVYSNRESSESLVSIHGQTVSRWVSLVRGNGDWILLIVAIPLVLSLVAAVLLILQARSKQTDPRGRGVGA